MELDGRRITEFAFANVALDKFRDGVPHFVSQFFQVRNARSNVCIGVAIQWG